MRLSVEFVTVGFLGIYRQYCCDWFPVSWRADEATPERGIPIIECWKTCNWNWGQCYWGVPQQWWPGSSSGCPSQSSSYHIPPENIHYKLNAFIRPWTLVYLQRLLCRVLHIQRHAGHTAHPQRGCRSFGQIERTSGCFKFVSKREKKRSGTEEISRRRSRLITSRILWGK